MKRVKNSHCRPRSTTFTSDSGASSSGKQSRCREREASQVNGSYEVELGFVLALFLVSVMGARATFLAFEGRCPERPQTQQLGRGLGEHGHSNKRHNQDT